MSDIFDERESIKSTKEVVAKLRDWYDQYLSGLNDNSDQDTRRRRTKLAMRMPDEELVRQLIIDAINVVKSFGVDPKDLKW